MIPALYHDEDILVLDKPAGLASQPGAGVRLSLVEAVERDYGFRPFLVHRLDKETAGCIIVARSARAAARWTALVESRELGKVYRAVVSGRPRAAHGVFDEALPGRGGPQSARTRWRLLASFGAAGPVAPGLDASTAPGIADTESSGHRAEAARAEAARAEAARAEAGRAEAGRPAAGHAEAAPGGATRSVAADASVAAPPFSYLELELDTGRMHQIRLHLSMAGLPILGDDRHGDFALNKRLRKEAGLGRLLLLSYALHLPGGVLVRASLPRHFIDFFSRYPDSPEAELP